MLAFLRLPGNQKKWFIRAWFTFLLWHIRIRFSNYKAWQNRVFPTTATSQSGYPANFVATIEKAGRHHLCHMNCLRRCLVTMEMSHRIDIYPTIHFGVKIENGVTKAHCWLSLNGALINDSEEVVSAYTELKTKNTSALFKNLT